MTFGFVNVNVDELSSPKGSTLKNVWCRIVAARKGNEDRFMKTIPMIFVALGTAVILWCVHGQAFGATYSDAAALADQSQSINNSFNSADPIRAIPITPAAPVAMRGGPSYFAGPGLDTGPQFIPAQELVKVLNAVDTAQEFIGDDEDEDIQAVVTIFAKNATAECKCIRFEIVNPQNTYTLNAPLAVASLKTDEDCVTSATLAAKLCQIAHQVGASKVVITREGVIAQLMSSGWGVGLSNSISVVNASPTGIGGFATSGTGYSSGKAFYLKLPYLIATFVK